MKTRDTNINAIIMNGDLVKHGVSINYKNATPEQIQEVWTAMKSIMSQVMNATRERYPNIPILPSIGNNDVIEHD